MMTDITYQKAERIVRDAVPEILESETVPLVLALNRTLSEDITADQNIPPFDNSAMDGFALRAADSLNAAEPGSSGLEIIGESAAGAPFAGTVPEGAAVRIMTGAIVPDGADSVIEVESTEEADGRVRLNRSIEDGNAIRRAGEDMAIGDVIIPAGKRISPGDVGVLASLGQVNVPVRLKPKVAILSTGRELVPAHESPDESQIRNSSGPALYAAVVQAGGEPFDLGIAGDDEEELQDLLEQALRFDIVLTTGGVSAGKYDFVQTILPKLDVDIAFHKLRMKPGKPLLFGTRDEGGRRTLVFGLPGNPVSSLLSFRQFVVPAIRKLMGDTSVPLRSKAVAGEEFRSRDGVTTFLRGVASESESGLSVKTTGTQSSGALSSMSKANAIIRLDADHSVVREGESVMIEWLV